MTVTQLFVIYSTLFGHYRICVAKNRMQGRHGRARAYPFQLDKARPAVDAAEKAIQNADNVCQPYAKHNLGWGGEKKADVVQG